MRKILSGIMMFILCFATISCSCTKNKPIELNSEQYVEDQGYIEFIESYDVLKNHIDNKDNMVFYMYGATCSGCHAFTPILREYVKEKGIKMYAIEVNTLDAANKGLKQTLGCTPAIAIFKEGSLYQYIDACQEGIADYFMSKEGFGTWFETYVVIK